MHGRIWTKILILVCVLHSPEGATWGPEGHTAVGVGAMALLDDQSRYSLGQLLGNLTNERMNELCNWPDAVRETPEWRWSSPQHYVNLPRSASTYLQDRDCANGLCVTEAIKKYAAKLQDDRLNHEIRIQAFAWLCHLVGDLHQPLHSGFADDRGGNRFAIEYRGVATDLHTFWDHDLIEDKAGDLDGLLQITSANQTRRNSLPTTWNPSDVDRWTEQSHQIAANQAYPDEVVISSSFADQTWETILDRLALASQRLALIINAILGEGEVVIDR